MKTLAPLILLITINASANSNWQLNQEKKATIMQGLEIVHAYKISKSNRSSGSFVTVGDDVSCDFKVGQNKIQNAIDSGASEIRLASNTQYQESIVISNTNVDLTIRGGFLDCTEANNNNQSNAIADRTEITRASGQVGPLFQITGLPGGNLTVFENIILNGGDGQGTISGGGLSLDDTEPNVHLQNVWITQNTNIPTGGGLSVFNSNSTVIVSNTDIFQNQAKVFGGGIFCKNFDGTDRVATIILTQTSGLYSNHVQQDGGGAYINKGCFFASFAGSKDDMNESGIHDNSAVDSGGGIYLTNRAYALISGLVSCGSIECFGNTQDPASIYSNQSNTDDTGSNNGGGIFASGLGTQVNMEAVSIHSNIANSASGGGMAIIDEARITVLRSGKACWDLVRCNFIRNNKSFLGGAVYNNNGFFGASHTYFEDNRAHFGMVLASRFNAETVVINSVINHNGNNGIGGYNDNYVTTVANDAEMKIAYSTFADNDSLTGVFAVVPGTTASIEIHTSIIHEDIRDVLGNGSNNGTFNSYCIMAHETSSFSGGDNSVDDPEFVDRANRDYHLNGNNSPAIDYCYSLNGDNGYDIDFQDRGWDDPLLSNFLGTIDLGADEERSNDFIFDNSFE